MKNIAGWASLTISHIYVVAGDSGLDLAFGAAWMAMSLIHFWSDRK